MPSSWDAFLSCFWCLVVHFSMLRDVYIVTYPIWHSEIICVFNCGKPSAMIISNIPSPHSLYSLLSEIPIKHFTVLNISHSTSQQLFKLLLSLLLLCLSPCFMFSVNSFILASILLITPSTMSNLEYILVYLKFSFPVCSTYITIQLFLLNFCILYMLLFCLF